MKRFAPSLVMLLAALNAEPAYQNLRHDWKRHFDAHGVEGTFVLFDPGSNVYGVHDVVRARLGYLPASTFEIPHALIDLEAGSSRDGRTGKQRMKEWLALFEYGNQSLEGGIEHFWLQGGLRISAVGQMEFLRRLGEGRLPVSVRSRRLVRDAMRVEEAAGGFTLYSKTANTGTRDPVAWWVGWVEQQGVPVAYFAMNATPTKAEPFGACEAIARAILADEVGYGR